MHNKSVKHKYYYGQVIPIKTQVSSAWHVKFADGHEEILCLEKSFTIELVVELIKNHSIQNFEVYPILVGRFKISKTENKISYGRGLNKNKMVVIL